ncbi:MAG: hypothetical protein VX641_04690 [Planctomycetota bacterium]|nr:hypothetical protein [Planctomycetota bacterium]
MTGHEPGQADPFIGGQFILNMPFTVSELRTVLDGVEEVRGSLDYPSSITSAR